MPINTETFLQNIYFLSVFKLGILIILIIYAIFAVLIIRQANLMGKTLITPASKILSAFSIIHAGIAIALIALAWGLL